MISGQIETRPDIYGLDKTIVGLLNHDTPSVDIPIARNYGGDSNPVRGDHATTSTAMLLACRHDCSEPRAFRLR